MRFWDYIKTAIENIASAKLRSLLTSLGIIIGIGSVVLINSIGGGVSSTITQTFSGLGTTQMTVSSSIPVAGSATGSGILPPGGENARNIGRGNVAGTLTLDDAEALLSVKGVAAAAPVLQVAAKITGSGDTLDLGITGTTPGYAGATNKTVVSGRVFDESAAEAVLNQSAVTALFGNEDALSQTVKINGTSYKVVGVFRDTKSPFAQARAGLGGGSSQTGANTQLEAISNSEVYIPASAALTLAGMQKVSQIAVAASSPDVVDEVMDNIRTTLTQRHDNVQDFTINSFQQLTASFSQIFNTLTLFLSAVAGISLLVGGIGIMNIMLVTVTERTREIGIAKAIGATSGSVVAQFLVESVTLSVIGGVLGLTLAWLGTVALGGLLGLPSLLNVSSIMLAVGVSAAIGIFFGVAPAWRAARLDPIIALRHE